MIKKKKILLICRESFSFPMFFLAKKLIADGSEVSAFFINPEESYYKKCFYNAHTYYNFKENLPDVKVYGLNEFCEKFNEKYQTNLIDMEYLEFVEKEFAHFKNFNLQLASSQLTTRHFHTRIYFNHTSFKQNLIFLELGYKKVIEVVEDFMPDVILDIEDAELLRTILNEVAFKMKIPYINIDYPRFEEYKIPTYCLGVQNEVYFKQKYNELFSASEQELKNEYEYISDFRQNKTIMSQEFRGTITSQYKPDSIYSVCKVLFGMLLYFWNLSITAGNWKLFKRKQILYSNPFNHFIFYVKVAIKKQLLFRKNRYFVAPEKDETYVYMPLHLIPESTTFVKAPFYINELHIIEQISKSLPLGWKLYVKEHQAMLGERDFSFYWKVKKIPNVKLVQFNYYNDPKPWIQNAKGVITISGTSAYEAAMLGKKAIVFSDVPFSLIDGITQVKSYQELPSLIADFGAVDNIKSCASYLATIKSVGKKINLKNLISESEAVIKGDKDNTEEFQSKIDELYDFFSDAYSMYSTRILSQ